MRRRHILVLEVIIALVIGSTLALAGGKSHIVFSTPGAQLQLRYLLVRTMNLTSAPEPIEITARTYTPRRLTLTRKQDNQTWQMTSQGPWGDMGRIVVPSGGTTTLHCGGPFRIVPNLSISRGTRSVNVDFAILGQSGERYSKVITRNGKTVPPPKVRILDEQGKTLASGQFAYG